MPKKGQKNQKHPHKALAPATIRNLNTPGLYPDGNALYLRVSDTGAKHWVQRLTIAGKRRDLGLGSLKLVSLKEARELALENRKMARSGGDPLAERRRAAGIPTFEAAARTVYELHAPTWKTEKHRKAWLATLEEYVFHHIGPKRVDLIHSGDVLRALKPIWNAKPQVATKIQQRIGRVLNHCIAEGWRLDNPAENIQKALPKIPAHTHHEALPYTEVADAVRKIRAVNMIPSAKLALEFLILTACRSSEVRGALWDEIDLEACVWTIPAKRMKAGMEHRIPFSPRCLEILTEAEALRDTSGLVFPGTVHGRPLSEMTLHRTLKGQCIACVPHGFRTSFRVWAGEQTNIPREVCELALAHRIKDRVEAAYARSDLFEKRRKLMERWASYLASSASAEVIPINKNRA